MKPNRYLKLKNNPHDSKHSSCFISPKYDVLIKLNRRKLDDWQSSSFLIKTFWSCLEPKPYIDAIRM